MKIIITEQQLGSVLESMLDDAFKGYEIVFKDKLSANPKDIRLILGLSYLLEMRHRYQESWNVYKTIVQATDDPIPYLYSIWLSPRFSTQMQEKKSGVQDILKQLTLKGDKAGSLRAMAMEMLGSVEIRNRNMKSAKQYYDGIKALSAYQIIGPFEHISASGFTIAYPPEDKFAIGEIYEGKHKPIITKKLFESTIFRKSFERSMIFKNGFYHKIPH